MDKLQEYLKAMKFKRCKIGGLDEEDVLEHIKEICDLAREELEEQAKNFSGLAGKTQEGSDELQPQQGEMEQQEDTQDLAEQERDRCRAIYQDLLVAVDALRNVNVEAEKAARQEMRMELQAEEDAARSKMLADIEQEQAIANQEIQRLNDEIEALSRQQQAMQEALRQEREQWKHHLDWFANRLNTVNDVLGDKKTV